MKKIIDKICICFTSLLWIIIFYCMCSCGARKVQKQQSKEETKTETVDNSVTEKQIDTNVKITTETKFDDKNETVTSEVVYEPADNSKESFVIEKDGTKVILNNAKKIVRNTAQKNNTISNTNQYVYSVQKEIEKEQKAINKKHEEKKENKSKQGERDQFSLYYLLWFVIPIGVIYYFYRRYKFF